VDVRQAHACSLFNLSDGSDWSRETIPVHWR
jgi:hypothetical protein